MSPGVFDHSKNYLNRFLLPFSDSQLAITPASTCQPTKASPLDKNGAPRTSWLSSGRTSCSISQMMSLCYASQIMSLHPAIHTMSFCSESGASWRGQIKAIPLPTRKKIKWNQLRSCWKHSKGAESTDHAIIRFRRLGYGCDCGLIQWFRISTGTNSKQPLVQTTLKQQLLL